MTNEEYRNYTEKHAPRSATKGNLLRAFLAGGLICALGQVIINGYALMGLDSESAGTAGAVTLILIGALLTGLGVYDNIARFGGAGTLVPITGFANSVAAPALEFKTEGFITGTGAKMFVIAGPVIVYGTAASVAYGIILCVVNAFS